MKVSPEHQAALIREWATIEAAVGRSLEVVEREGVTVEELRELIAHAETFNGAFVRATAVLQEAVQAEIRTMAGISAHQSLHGDGGHEA